MIKLRFLLLALSVVLFSVGVRAAEQSDPVRGVIRAVNLATISTELSARVREVKFREGELFRPGDLLVRFDCQRMNAEANAAAAQARARRQTYKTNQELAQRQAVGRDELAVSKAEYEQARAQSKAARVRGRECEIHAPFAGIVSEKMIQAHEMSVPGEPLLKIVGTKEIEVELILPSAWLAWLKTGASFEFSVDETANTHMAQIVRLGGAVDPASQTVKAYGKLTDTKAKLMPGMSGSAHFGGPNG